MDSDHDDYSVYILPDSAERYGMYVCIAINDVGVSEPCERMVSGAGTYDIVLTFFFVSNKFKSKLTSEEENECNFQSARCPKNLSRI